MRARFSDESWQERRDVALKRGLWRFATFHGAAFWCKDGVTPRCKSAETKTGQDEKRALRAALKTLRVSSAPHPAGFESRRRDSKKPVTGRVTGFSLQMVPPTGCPRAAAPPASAAALRTLRAALENAARFLSSAPCRVRIPARRWQKARYRRGNGLLKFDGAPNGIRTRDIHLERVASLAARRWGQRS